MRLILFLPLVCSLHALAAPAPPSKTPVCAKAVPNSAAAARDALVAAIRADDAAAIAVLMKRGARPDAGTLGAALGRAKLATWKALFDGGVRADVPIEIFDDENVDDEKVQTVPLIIAVAQNATTNGDSGVALLRLLIARGADVNARARDGQTALQVATQVNGDADGNGDVAQILLAAGARVAPNDAWLLAYAARIASPNLLQSALAAGTLPTCAEARKLHLLQAALDLRRFAGENGPLNSDAPSVVQAHNAGRARVVAMLLDAGVAPNDLDERGQTPLMLAADGGLRPDLVEMLLKRGANPNLRRVAPPENPRTPATGENAAPARRHRDSGTVQSPTIWQYALSVRRFSAQQIANGLNWSDEAFGFFPLGNGSFRAPTPAEVMARQSPDETRTLQLLLEAAVPLELPDARGQTALMLAAKNNRARALRFFTARGANLSATDKAGDNALLLAAGTDAPDAIAALLEAGAVLETRDKSGLTPLLMAAGAGVTGTTFYGPLSMSIEGYSGGPEALRALVARGADVGAQDASGATALHWMARHGDTKDAQFLMKRGAPVNAQTINGATPLHIAVTSGDYSMAKLLLQLGADASLQAQGQTPLDLARAPYHTKIKVAGEDPAHPAPETRKLLSQYAKSDRQITLKRGQIAELLQPGRSR